MVLLKDIDAHFSEMLSKFGIEDLAHQDFYLKKIKPLIAKELQKGLSRINFISEDGCDEFFKSFKSEHWLLFKEAYDSIQPLILTMKKSQHPTELEAQISSHINSYISNVAKLVNNLWENQIKTCAQSIFNSLDLFDKKSQDQRWQMLNAALKKQLKMYSEQFKKLKVKLTELLTKEISVEPILSEFKNIYDQALNLMYSCKEAITEARNRTQDPAEKPLLDQLRIIVQMLWKRLYSLFSASVTKIFTEKQQTSAEFLGFSQSSSSTCHVPQSNLRH